MLDSEGSYVLIDINGQISWFTIRDKQGISMYIDLAKYAQVNKDVVDALESSNHIPFLYKDSSTYTIAPEKWGVLLHKAKYLKGLATDYYYAYIKNSDQYSLNGVEPYLYDDLLHE